jgi:hypothetical protein
MSPRVDISSTCMVGQKIGVSLPMLTCSPSAWPSLLLYCRGQKSQRDLRITLYILLCCIIFIFVTELQDAYKLSKYFAQPYFHKYWTEIHDVTTIWKRNVCSFIVTLNVSKLLLDRAVNRHKTVKLHKFQTHQLRSVGEAAISLQHWFMPFPRDGSSDYRAIPNLRSLCVIDTNFTILQHFLLKLWCHEILWYFIRTLYFTFTDVHKGGAGT